MTPCLRINSDGKQNNKNMSDKSSSSSSSSGIGFGGLLTVLFIGLKLTGFINWSWVWVLAPLWIGAAIGIIILLVILGIALWASR